MHVSWVGCSGDNGLAAMEQHGYRRGSICVLEGNFLLTTPLMPPVGPLAGHPPLGAYHSGRAVVAAPSTQPLLEIAPGLDQSILLSVLIGLLVVFAFTESYGWAFVGMAVPGYLASVFVVEPVAAMAITLDAVLTYVIARGLAGILGQSGASAEFFGRDRFFFIVLVSVLVRQQTDAWLFALISGQLGLPERAPEAAHSMSTIGLVLVPLAANVLWKLQARRGLAQMAVTLGVVFALLELVLLPYTTLSYGSVGAQYESAAVDFMGNAKAYMILLTTAYLASIFNLRYGWDFGGILVPALLAILWLSPTKLLITLLESFVIAILFKRIVGLPRLRTLNLEGPRKLTLIFVVSILAKWGIGALAGPRLPGLTITDLYGFGYLLPSLLALRILRYGSARRVLIPTAVTSATGFLAGSVLGFLFELATTSLQEDAPADRGVATHHPLHSLDHFAGLASVRSKLPPEKQATYQELIRYDLAWRAIVRWLEKPGQKTQAEAMTAAQTAGLEFGPPTVNGMEDGYAIFSRNDDGHSPPWDSALLYPNRTGPILRIDDPSEYDLLPDVAVRICERLRCRGVVVSGPVRRSTDLSVLGVTPLEVVDSTLSRLPTVALHVDPTLPDPEAILYVTGRLPPIVDLPRLWDRELRLLWRDPRVRVLGWGRANLVALSIRPEAIKGHVTRHVSSPPSAPSVGSWFSRRWRGANPDVERREPARLEELLLFEDMVATLLRETAKTGSTPLTVSWKAARLGCQLWRIDDCGGHGPCWAVTDAIVRRRGGFGTIVARTAAQRPVVVEVPAPAQYAGTWEMGLQMWNDAGARALMISDPAGHPDRAGWVASEIATPLQAAHQAFDTALGPGGTVLQVAGFGEDRHLGHDVVVGLGQHVFDPQRAARIQELLQDGEMLDWVDDAVMADGSSALFDLAGTAVPQIRYSSRMGRSRVAKLWFSPQIRRGFRFREYRSIAGQFAAIGVDPAVRGELETLSSTWQRRGLTGPVPPEFATLLSLAETYATSENVNVLARLFDSAAGTGVDVSVGFGRGTSLPHVWITAGRAAALVRLRTPTAIRSLVRADLDHTGVQLRRSLWKGHRSIIVSHGEVAL